MVATLDKPVIERKGPMHNPPHPGEVLHEMVMKPLKLSVTDAAAALGVARRTLSLILNGHSGISPEMAIRIGTATKTSPEMWLGMQTAYDLWQARKKRVKVKAFAA